MNRDFLRQLGLSKDIIDKIMAEYGKEKKKWIKKHKAIRESIHP